MIRSVWTIEGQLSPLHDLILEQGLVQQGEAGLLQEVHPATFSAQSKKITAQLQQHDGHTCRTTQEKTT